MQRYGLPIDAWEAKVRLGGKMTKLRSSKIVSTRFAEDLRHSAYTAGTGSAVGEERRNTHPTNHRNLIAS